MRTLALLILFTIIYNCGKLLEPSATEPKSGGQNVIEISGVWEGSYLLIKYPSEYQWLGYIYLFNAVDSVWFYSSRMFDSVKDYGGSIKVYCNVPGVKYRVPFVRK